ncbi:MAG: DUF4197 domain-containing protein [Pseudomonadota bacterium]
MHRRQFHAAVATLALGSSLSPAAFAQALSLASISNADATGALKTALETGAIAAVQLLGAPDGFLSNPKVRIPLPGYLQDAAKLMRTLGQGRRVDELETAMNRAAESAVPLARDMLVKAARSVTVSDAKKILTGGDTSVTEFFAGRTRAPLATQFLPVVKRETAKVSLAEKYDQIAKKGVSLGLVKPDDASIDHYVTRKALDGLYLIIGEQERKIRQDPIGTGSALLGRVFGALR